MMEWTTRSLQNTVNLSTVLQYITNEFLMPEMNIGEADMVWHS